MIPLVSPQNGGNNNNDYKDGHGHSDDQGIISLQKSNITLLYTVSNPMTTKKLKKEPVFLLNIFS